MQNRLLRLPEVMERTGLKRSTIYKYMNLGKFPLSKGNRQTSRLEGIRYCGVDRDRRVAPKR